MLEIELGRRYERLLFASAPVSLIAVFVLLVAIANAGPGPLGKASCYERYAKAIEARYDALKGPWEKAKPKPKDILISGEYQLQLKYALIDSTLGSSCYLQLKTEVDERALASPEIVVKRLRDEAIELRRMPITLSGVQLPSSTKFELFGNPLTVQTTELVQAVQVALAPVFLLWLGSLYTTRYRETLRIASTRSISEVFPHIVNMYPVGRLPVPKRRSWAAYFAPLLISIAYALTRISLLSIFIGPPIAAYGLSIFFLFTNEWWQLWIALGIFIGAFLFSLVAIEFAPWHLGKVYPQDAGAAR